LLLIRSSKIHRVSAFAFVLVVLHFLTFFLISLKFKFTRLDLNFRGKTGEKSEVLSCERGYITGFLEKAGRSFITTQKRENLRVLKEKNLHKTQQI
jgi:hypothetical protein